MALLNKLFFPTATPATSSPTVTTTSATTTSSIPTSLWTTSTSATSAATATSTGHSNKRQNNNQTVHSRNYLSQFPFDGRQVRVLLFRECDSRGRRLLFDSNALQKVHLSEANGNVPKTEKTTAANNSLRDISSSNRQEKRKDATSQFIQVCEEYGYKHNRPNCSADITSIGEMVFGALAMTFRGTALKVHWLQGPARILCSQVFLTPLSTANSQSPYSSYSMTGTETPRTSISSEHGSMDGLSMNSLSMPFSVSVDRHISLTPSDRCAVTFPLDVPEKQSTASTNAESVRADSGSRYSATYTDSGYSGMSRSRLSSDQWSGRYSTRSSLGSVISEQSDRSQSIDSSYFPAMPHSDDLASDGSLQRRILRNLRTSFENENSANDFIGFVSDKYPNASGSSEGANINVLNYRRASYCANESRSNPEIGKRRDAALMKSLARRAKLGLAVCLTMSESFEEEMELFCSEHIALLESMLGRLRAFTERAYLKHSDFLQIMYHAWRETEQWFNDLFTAPRVKCPVWLSITTSGSKYSKNVAERFIKELCWLLSFADTKDTNFFISTMLTGILTNHLGWVSTVTAFNCASSRSETAAAAIVQRAKLLQISQKHPYNALWAQMGDLYGAVGKPPKLTRTVVFGTEKLSVERLLNILTYFIRCGEVRRSSSKREDFSKEVVDSIVGQNNNESLRARPFAMRLRKSMAGTMSRAQTSRQNLNTIADSYELSSDEEDTDLTEIGHVAKKNEIPNVLAFRDSRFVQQELRIGNYLMDTGIEKNSLRMQKGSTSNSNDGKIRLTVTTPDNVEMFVEDDKRSSSEDGAMEAIEIEPAVGAMATVEANSTALVNPKRNFFWKIVPPAVKEGLSLSELQNVSSRRLARRSSTFSNQSEPIDGAKQQLRKRMSQLSLSDLITQNSIGKSDRMTWGTEPIKEIVSLEEQMHFELCHKLIERQHGISREDDADNGVVFVLGDNEPLVNLRRSNEELQSSQDQQPTLCPFMHDPTHFKKHSNVKFNFEQYPQIATNYMRSKNLNFMSNYDLLLDKCTKLEAQESGGNMSINDESKKESETRHNQSSGTSGIACVVCDSILNCYQTPSNATELEFEVDEVPREKTLQTVSSAASVATLTSPSTPNDVASSTNKGSQCTKESTTLAKKTLTYCGNSKKVSSRRGSISSVAAKCAAVNEAVHLLKLPVPGIKDVQQDDEPPDEMKLRAGFIPSLFLNVSDHYVSDMVLQGTLAPPAKWEMSLREDLALAARSSSLISLPAENIAIVADMQKWDVRLISSHMQSFPYNGVSTPVGMSQLVSSMLETVQAMNSSNISAYECLSFLESKMQEIYLQSEALAAFLLETDFCPLSTVTTALNLSENDVPLLISIASTHTPQISKKCGISFTR